MLINMKLKKLDFMNVSRKGTLSRNEMKSIMAGGNEINNQSMVCLYCFSCFGTDSCWYRTNPSGSADVACRQIYPTCGTSVSGN